MSTPDDVPLGSPPAVVVPPIATAPSPSAASTSSASKPPRKTVLLTGGSGTLGTHLQKHFGRARLLHDVRVVAPSSKEFNVADYGQMEEYFDRVLLPQYGKDAGPPHIPPTIVHCAAFVSTVDMRQPEKIIKGIDTNVIGTSNICKLALKHGLQVIYISTDYVFDGKKPGGLYTETEPTRPVNNYGLSKLGGECVVQMVPNHVIIRCPFGPNTFPYAKAFVDQYTSRQPVAIASRDVAKLLELIFADKVQTQGIIHSIYDYAVKDLKAVNVGKLERKDVDVDLAADCSLDCSRFKDILWRQRDAWIDGSPRDEEVVGSPAGGEECETK
eukprot:g13201.t1